MTSSYLHNESASGRALGASRPMAVGGPFDRHEANAPSTDDSRQSPLSKFKEELSKHKKTMTIVYEIEYATTKQERVPIALIEEGLNYSGLRHFALFLRYFMVEQANAGLSCENPEYEKRIAIYMAMQWDEWKQERELPTKRFFYELEKNEWKKIYQSDADSKEITEALMTFRTENEEQERLDRENKEFSALVACFQDRLHITELFYERT